MEKESQIKFTVTSTTVGELFDKTIDKFFKDKLINLIVLRTMNKKKCTLYTYYTLLGTILH